MGALLSAVLLVSHRHQPRVPATQFPPRARQAGPGAGSILGHGGGGSVSQSPSRTSDNQRDHLPMTLTFVLTILAAIAVVFDAITPRKR
jgi:hypothetical protein